TSAGIPALIAQVQAAARVLVEPAARVIERGASRTARLREIEAILAIPGLVVDACRRVVRSSAEAVSLTGRPVLFALARELGEAFPVDVPRDRLIERVFDARRPNESHRVRLRVELGRLRKALGPIAGIEA